MIFLLTMLSASVWASAQTLCQKDEKVFFSCKTKSKKIISVCGSSAITKEVGYLQYRFGNTGKIELEYPSTRIGTQKLFFYVLYTRPQTSYNYLKFTNDDTEYAIYRGSSDNKVSSGLEITLSNSKEVRIDCTGEVINDIHALKSVASCDKEDALNMGSCP